MFIRIVRPQLKPGQAEEAARRWEALMGPKGKANPNFQRGFFSANSDRTSVVAVTLWDELPSDEMTKQVQEEIANELRDLMAGPPSIENYEVLAQI